MGETPHLAYGRHVLVDIADTNAALLNDGGALTSALTDAAVAEGATVLGTIEHAFEPNGVTILVLLAESHVSLHTYPNEGKWESARCGFDRRRVRPYVYAERYLRNPPIKVASVLP